MVYYVKIHVSRDIKVTIHTTQGVSSNHSVAVKASHYIIYSPTKIFIVKYESCVMLYNNVFFLSSI